MYQLTVADMMTTDLITLERSETIDLAEEIMRLARVRHLPVVDKKKLVGLVTHRDLLRAQVSALAGLNRDERRDIERTIPVASIMTENVRAVSPQTPSVVAARLMRDNKFGCLPVVDEQRHLVGLVTEADFLELVIRSLAPAA